jgi:hypothetical protein
MAASATTSSLEDIVGTTCDCISEKLQRSEILAVASVRHIGHNVSIFQIVIFWTIDFIFMQVIWIIAIAIS